MSWKTVALGDVCKVIAGQSPEGKYYNNDGVGLPFYQGKKDFGKVYINPPSVWTTEITKEAIKDDILMSVRAPVGPVNISIENICIGRGLAAIRSSEKIDKSYLFNYLLSIEKDLVGSSGAVFNSINKGQIEKLEIPLPPLATQQKIVDKLDAIFAEIDKATAAAEANAKNAEALFQSYLRKVFERDTFVKLSSITDEITDGDHQPPPKANEGVPFITISNVNKFTREIDFSNTFKVSKEYFKALKSNRRPMLGDVLYTVTGSFGIPVYVDKEVEFCFQRHIGLIRPSLETHSKWLYWLMLSPQVSEQAKKSATGAAQLTVSLKAIRNFDVPFMSLKEQIRVAEESDAFFEQVRMLQERYKDKVKEIGVLKTSILRQAFSGELVKE